MEPITINYKTSQEGCFLLGRLNALSITFNHTVDDNTIIIYPVDQCDLEDIDDILDSTKFFSHLFPTMAKKEAYSIYCDVRTQHLISDIKDYIIQNFMGFFNIDEDDDEAVEEVLKQINYQDIADDFLDHYRFDWDMLEQCITDYLNCHKNDFCKQEEFK